MTTSTAKQGKTVSDKANASRASADVNKLFDGIADADGNIDFKKLEATLTESITNFVVGCGVYAVLVTFGFMGVNFVLSFMAGWPIMASIVAIFGLCIVLYGAIVASTAVAPHIVKGAKRAYTWAKEKVGSTFGVRSFA